MGIMVLLSIFNDLLSWFVVVIDSNVYVNEFLDIRGVKMVI